MGQSNSECFSTSGKGIEIETRSDTYPRASTMTSNVHLGVIELGGSDARLSYEDGRGTAKSVFRVVDMAEGPQSTN